MGDQVTENTGARDVRAPVDRMIPCDCGSLTLRSFLLAMREPRCHGCAQPLDPEKAA